MPTWQASTAPTQAVTDHRSIHSSAAVATIATSSGMAYMELTRFCAKVSPSS